MKKLLVEKALFRGLEAYNNFIEIQYYVKNSEEDIQLDFRMNKTSSYTFVVGICTLILLANEKGINICVTANEKLINQFFKIGLLNDSDDITFEITDLSKMLEKNFRMIKTSEDIFNIGAEITKNAKVIMDNELEEEFTSRVGEMFLNSMEHSNAINIFGCKFIKYDNNLCFICYDTGIGIPEKVIEHVEKTYETKFLEKQAFKWAMDSGNSTSNSNVNGVPRGIGLSLLKEFASLNNGTIKICSGSIMYKFSSQGEKYSILKKPFTGTFFEMLIVADNKNKYSLK